MRLELAAHDRPDRCNAQALQRCFERLGAAGGGRDFEQAPHLRRAREGHNIDMAGCYRIDRLDACLAVDQTLIICCPDEGFLPQTDGLFRGGLGCSRERR